MKKSFVSFDKELAQDLRDPDFRREWAELDNEYAPLVALLDLRHKKGLSQRALAQQSKLNQAAVARIERGQNVTAKTLRRIADATGTSLKIEFV